MDARRSFGSGLYCDRTSPPIPLPPIAEIVLVIWLAHHCSVNEGQRAKSHLRHILEFFIQELESLEASISRFDELEANLPSQLALQLDPNSFIQIFG